METCSPATWLLWGKLDPTTEAWMPLVQHLQDSAGVAGMLFDQWLCQASKDRLAEHFQGMEAARSAVCFLAGIHDLGKATPDFQIKATRVPGFSHLGRDLERAGYRFPLKMTPDLKPHGLLGQVAVEDMLTESEVPPRGRLPVAAIVGSHHGRGVRSTGSAGLTGLGEGLWHEARREIWSAMADYSGISDFRAMFDRRLPAWAQVQLNGIVVMADWMASNVDLFPYQSSGHSARLASATAQLELPDRWTPRTERLSIDEVFAKQFPHLQGAVASPLQRAAVRAARDVSKPCLLVLEAPTGDGKTEAALMAASVLAERFGFGGVMAALPTMATSNPMFTRVNRWLHTATVSGRTTLNLVHGKASLNEDYAALVAGRMAGIADEVPSVECPDVYVASWFRGRRRGVLAAHVVGTIDQVLFAGLRAKHTMLRQLAVASKVVIIDEVHAADDYMRVYLARTLTWLGHHAVPVILLSATLPPAVRDELTTAYAKGIAGRGVSISLPPAGPYPRITCVEAAATDVPVGPRASRTSTHTLLSLPDDIDSLASTLREELADGGCAAVICSTVGRAQERYRALKNAGLGEVRLVHSKFIAPHRARIEADLVSRLGPGGERPERLIVVGTQVLEQSLDVDFDVMVSDIAPLDLLIQRLGRLHRHDRKRPPHLDRARCHITGVDWAAEVPDFDSGVLAVYRRWRLLSTLAVLGHLPRTITTPDEIPSLVATAYEDDREPPAGWESAWHEALHRETEFREHQRLNALAFAVDEPSALWALANWADAPADDPDTPRSAKAAVRDTDESLEVIVVQADGAGNARLLDGIGEFAGSLLPRPLGEWDTRLAKAAASCTVALPRSLTTKLLDQILTELERYDTCAWQSSPWLAGELFLELDRHGRTELAGQVLAYDPELGLREE